VRKAVSALRRHRWEIREGNSLKGMRAMPRASVDAIVTSPPYGDQRRYDGTAARANVRANRNGRKAGNKNESRLNRSAGPARGVEFLEPFLAEMLGVLKPEGGLMLNLGPIMRDGEDSAWEDEVLRRARTMGWKLLQRIVWHKPNGMTLSSPRYMRVCHEMVFWLAPSVNAYRGYDRDTRSPHTEVSIRRVRAMHDSGVTASAAARDGDVTKRSPKHFLHPDGAKPGTVFECGVGGTHGVKHPAIMPVRLALHLVSLACPPGGLVLDPFAGSGTTGIAALRRGRNFLGFELIPGYASEARERIAGDAPLLNAPPDEHDEQLSMEALA
jgi:DNA modification methylase